MHRCSNKYRVSPSVSEGVAVILFAQSISYIRAIQSASALVMKMHPGFTAARPTGALRRHGYIHVKKNHEFASVFKTN